MALYGFLCHLLEGSILKKDDIFSKDVHLYRGSHFCVVVVFLVAGYINDSSCHSVNVHVVPKYILGWIEQGLLIVQAL